MRTIDQKVAQILMFGFYGTTLPKNVGGVIIFERNVKGSRKFVSRTKIPQFIAVDQEGGRVNRITNGVTILPSANEIKNVKEAYKYGKILAEELISLGINVDFAPVVDVNTESRNPIIGNRSFSSNSKTVVKLSTAMIRGMQNRNLIACAKHFPGHGAAKKDSHKCLPTITLSLKQWYDVHLPPFVSAIKAGVNTIMVGHILCPSLDRKYPASLSSKVITGILKKKLRFRGLIITDDLCMKAITKHYDPVKAAIMAFNAGADIILICKNSRMQENVRRGLVKAVKNGEISKERLDESFDRILKIKNKKLKVQRKDPKIHCNKMRESLFR